jgi:RecB family endonuclease NucS
MATRLLVVKADGSVLVHSDGGSYKPLNWMSPPCTLREEPGTWTVTNQAGEQLVITIEEIVGELSHDLGVDPGLIKDGVEAHLQILLAAHIETFGAGYQLVRREYPTPVGPVDILARDPSAFVIEVDLDGEPLPARSPKSRKSRITGPPARARHIAIEIKRRAGIDAVEQLTRYLELLNRDPLLAPVAGVLAAQTIAPQARTLAEDRGIRCVVVDYDELRGLDDPSLRLF